MKVLIISSVFLPVPAVKGGAVQTLIERLIEQNEKQHKFELTVVGSYDPEAEKKSKLYPDTRFIFIKKPQSRVKTDKVIDTAMKKLRLSREPHSFTQKLYIIKQLKKILLSESFDRVVFQNSGYPLNVLKDKKIAEKYRGKVYFHAHNDIPDNIYLDGLRQCGLILISAYLMKKINRLCPGMGDKARVVKNGFNTKLFAEKLPESEKKALREKHGIAADKKIVMFAGRIAPYKGVSQLLDAFNSLGRDDSVLLIIGSHNFGGSETSDFEISMKKKFNEASDRLVFTGYVPYDEMHKYYKLADVCVLPSTWEEPAGLTMAETVVCGVPLITTNAGGIPEYIHFDSAVLLERGDRLTGDIAANISAVLDNIEEWKIRAEKNVAQASREFSSERFFEDFADAVDLT